MRKKVIAGNWKMNMLPNEAIAFIEEFTPLVKDSENEVVLCVPYTDLFYALLTAQNTNIKIGAQNMHWKDSGAYTGEIAPKMLKSIGVEYVILGHSERRQYYNETDETVNLKLKGAFEAELKPIVCVGETLEQREAGITVQIITTQTRLALDGLTDEQVKNTIIAYEPIWAIGTGKTAICNIWFTICRILSYFIISTDMKTILFLPLQFYFTQTSETIDFLLQHTDTVFLRTIYTPFVIETITIVPQ